MISPAGNGIVLAKGTKDMERKILTKTSRKVAPTEVKAITGDDFIRSRILTIRG